MGNLALGPSLRGGAPRSRDPETFPSLVKRARLDPLLALQETVLATNALLTVTTATQPSLLHNPCVLAKQTTILRVVLPALRIIFPTFLHTAGTAVPSSFTGYQEDEIYAKYCEEDF
ncbi:hypothetical protein NMY22_g3637 [Coprinellus aureogranulatus]|nr:hypothetical protein NMY22_g3637 [Coprinellus aureogranulatus]